MNTPRRQKKFQFPLYMLMMFVSVIGLVHAPFSHFMRADPEDRRTRLFALGLMIAGPMLLVVLRNVLTDVVRRLKR